MPAKVIHCERTTPGTRTAVWDLLDNSHGWVSWTPIDECDVIVAHTANDHEVRRIRNGRVRLTEEIVQRQPGQIIAYTVLSGLAARDYLATVSLEDTQSGTRIRWHTEFRPKIPGTGWIYLFALRRATIQFVDGLVAATTPQP